MTDLDTRKNAALKKIANRVFGESAILRAEHDARDVYVDIKAEVTLSSVEAFMALLEPASVTIGPMSEDATELGFFACRVLPWER